MKVTTVVVGEGDYSPLDDAMVRISMQSMRLAGAEPAKEPPDDAVVAALQEGAEYVHLIKRGTVVLPSFYQAMINACDQAGTDYAYCYAVRLDSKPGEVKNPTPESIVMGQVLVRAWVLAELGPTMPPGDILKRVVLEYRGTEVPHVLVMEVGE